MSNGPQRAQSKEAFRVFCDVAGRRYLPGICWYPAKGTFIREIKVAPRMCCTMGVVISSLTEVLSVKGVLFFSFGRKVMKGERS